MRTSRTALADLHNILGLQTAFVDWTCVRCIGLVRARFKNRESGGAGCAVCAHKGFVPWNVAIGTVGFGHSDHPAAIALCNNTPNSFNPPSSAVTIRFGISHSTTGVFFMSLPNSDATSPAYECSRKSSS